MEKNREQELRGERSLFVVKSNSLIQKTRYELSLEEQRLLLYIISKIKPEDEKMKMQEFTIRDYCDVCGINVLTMPNMYGYMKETIKSLADKSFWVRLDDGKEILLRWIDKAGISKYSGKVAVRLNDDLIPYLLELKGLYTEYQLISVLPMKKKYSVRLYEILRTELHRGNRYKEVVYTLEELQDRLGITNENGKSYRQNPTMFRKFVVDDAIEEIGLYTDIAVNVEYMKTGRRIDRARFEIRELKDSKAMENMLRAERELYKKSPDTVTDTVIDTDTDAVPVESTQPTLEEVKAYCQERGNKVDAERWFDHYTANGWKVGKNPMQDWKASVRTWERGEVQRARSRNTLLNYEEKGKSHAQLKEIELNLDEL